MQRTSRNSVLGNNAMVKEVKISRMTPEPKIIDNITHINPQIYYPYFNETKHTETDKGERTHYNQKNLFNLNKLFEFAKSDEFIILAVIAILIIEGTEDIILILALGYILIAEKFGL